MIKDRRLFLIRHCQSAVDATRDPSTWGLTPRGAKDAGRLARSSLFSGTAVVAAGDEPKMVESVRPLADQLAIGLGVSAGLRESTSGGWVPDSEFEHVVRRFLEVPGQAPAVGWESAETTVDRFLTEVEELAATEPAGDIVVCTGGRVLTATLIQIGLLSTEDALDAWSALQMPDVVPVAFNNRGEPSLPGSPLVDTMLDAPKGDDGNPD
ncbi:MAG: histidine phosphatase family protein [Acidimicrobiales bacterium]